MKIKVNEASGVVLDWMVAKAEGHNPTIYNMGDFIQLYVRAFPNDYRYFASSNWAQGGPIIERYLIETSYNYTFELWIANGVSPDTGPHETSHENLLTAAMQCYVLCILGPEVDVPDELITGG